MTDIRFTVFRPTMVEHSHEPTLYDILVNYYLNGGFNKPTAECFAKEYIEKWCNMEKVI